MNEAHERQWGKLVTNILGEFELWPREQCLKVLNVYVHTELVGGVRANVTIQGNLRH